MTWHFDTASDAVHHVPRPVIRSIIITTNLFIHYSTWNINHPLRILSPPPLRLLAPIRPLALTRPPRPPSICRISRVNPPRLCPPPRAHLRLRIARASPTGRKSQRRAAQSCLVHRPKWGTAAIGIKRSREVKRSVLSMRSKRPKEVQLPISHM